MQIESSCNPCWKRLVSALESDTSYMIRVDCCHVLKPVEIRVESAWSQRLNMKYSYDKLLLCLAFNFNLRHYCAASPETLTRRSVGHGAGRSDTTQQPRSSMPVGRCNLKLVCCLFDDHRARRRFTWCALTNRPRNIYQSDSQV